MYRSPLLLAVLLTLTSSFGCAESPSSPDPEGCLPDQAQWEDVVRPMIANHCGLCHGTDPDYGAPDALLDYDALVMGEPGTRLADRMSARIGEGTMPPAGQPLLPHPVFDTVIQWASCGEDHPDYAEGLIASAPVFQAPSTPTEDLPHFDVTADGFPVAKDAIDLYQCFTIEAPLDEERFIRRVEVIQDKSQVLHHAILLQDKDKEQALGTEMCYGMPSGSNYIYAWAPGTGPIEFPDGGIRLAPGDRLLLQIHYNNGAGIEGLEDTSGIRVFHGPVEGKEYGMFAPGPLSFKLPAGEETTIEGRCTVPQDFDVLTGIPHMHEIGESFQQTIERLDGTLEEVIALSGWSFEMQLFYDTPVQLKAGDTLVTRCTYQNPYDYEVTSGEGTSDEMCFNFLYVSPPPPDRYCDIPPTKVLEYTPGECAPDIVPDELPVVEGKYIESAPPALLGGELADGDYALVHYEVFILPPGIPIGELDYEKSFVEAMGMLRLEDGVLQFDYGTHVHAELIGSDITIEEAFVLTNQSDITLGPEAGQIALHQTCPELIDEPFLGTYDVAGDSFRLALEVLQGPIALVAQATWARISD